VPKLVEKIVDEFVRHEHKALMRVGGHNGAHWNTGIGWTHLSKKVPICRTFRETPGESARFAGVSESVREISAPGGRSAESPIPLRSSGRRPPRTRRDRAASVGLGWTYQNGPENSPRLRADRPDLAL
jgi:hypothetical protein